MFIAPSDINYKNMDIDTIRKLSKKSSDTHTVFTPTTFKDPKLNELSQSNPYATVNYRKSWWQGLLQNLGFRTNYDTYLESMKLQAQEYDNQLRMKEYQENYDSPASQAMREREAGLNPDLTGNISAGESPILGDDGNPPVAPEADDFAKVTEFGASILQGVQVAFGLFGDMQNIRKMTMENESSMQNLVKTAWKSIIPDIYEARNNSQDGSVSVYNHYYKLKHQFGEFMSKKQFDRFVSRVNAFSDTAEGWEMMYDQQSRKAKARKSMFQDLAPESYSEFDDVMKDIGDALGNMAMEVFWTGQQNQLDFNKEYNGKVAGRLTSNPNDLVLSDQAVKAGENDLHLQENQMDLSDYQKQLRSTFKQIIDDLDRRADQGNKFAAVAKGVLSVILMGNLPMPSFSRTTGPKGTNTSFSF